MERAIPPPIIVPSLPQVLIYAAPAGSVESKSLFRGRNSTSVADATHERARTTRLSIGLSSASASPARIFARGGEHALGRGGPLSTKVCHLIVTLTANCSQSSRTKYIGGVSD
jgi:hypothetical protein